MPCKLRPASFLLLLFLGGACLDGCSSTPSSGSDPSLTQPGASTVYWSCHDVPQLTGKGIRKVVITEFALEYVTDKYDKGGSGPITGGAATLGIGRRKTEFPEPLMRSLPRKLYDIFVEKIKARQIEVPEPLTVAMTDAYQSYETWPTVESSPSRYLMPIGSDTGRIRATVLRPVRGLYVIIGGFQAEIEDVDARLLAELDADLVIRARFRVGVHEGKASLERGSVVTFTGRGILGSMTSNRSITSDDSVLKGGGLKPSRAIYYEVDPELYRPAMEALFSTYLGLGFQELTREDR